jgi:outer membrane assembly lipoprotein YfgL
MRMKPARIVLGSMALALLAACSSTPDKPKPTELSPNPALMNVRLAWQSKLAPMTQPLEFKVIGDNLAYAGADGVVGLLDARTGSDVWRGNAGAALAAGVGSDGRVAAVVTRGNELVVLDQGKESWRQKIAAQVFTSPLVAGGRVFVLSADRAVTAFDAQTGRKLWSQVRAGDSLILRQAGVLMAVGDTLVSGLSGKLVGMNPLNGSTRWEAPIASPRGTNDVERLVDLVAGVSRDGDSVCARAFQAAVGCVNAARGNLLWTKPAAGAVGVHGDDKNVFGTEADGTVIAWQRSNGERAWVSERLRYRGLTAPVLLGRSLAVGDEAGLVHLLSRADGTALTRLTTDGSAVLMTPVLAGGTLVVLTRNGGMFGFKPD